MKTKINQIDGLNSALQYQEAIIISSDIQVEQVGTLPIKFKLLADVSGTVTVNGLPLKDTDGVAVTSLENGLYEVVYDTGFFTLKSSGGSEKNFLMKYNGVDQLILDLKGSPINVSIGDYVYNEFNYTKLLGAENIQTIDRTTPIQVVNSAYDTSGNGGRKLVRLDNGWLVSVVRDTTNGRVRFHKSQDSGATWAQIGYIATSVNSVAITNIGNIIKLVLDQGAQFDIVSFDATQNSGDIPINLTNFPSYFVREIDTGQTNGSIQSCSIAIDQNGHLHATWVSKNATYPNSFNIRYSKSTDGGVTWSSPTQVTTSNSTGQQKTAPCIVIGGDGYPKIFLVYDVNPQWYILCMTFNGTSWTQRIVYMAGVYTETQANPSATVDSNGVIHVAWHGKDATDTTRDNIRYSSSANDGVTWSAMAKLTTGNTVDRRNPSIVTDLAFGIYIAYEDNGTLKYLKNNGSWASPVTITTGTNASVCDNYKNFENPMTLFDGGADVKFYGKWTDDLTPVQIIPPMSLATNKEQLQALYADTLKMYNPNTDARYQGFISKKDLWTTALQELDWNSANIKKDVNMFGKIGTVTPYEIASGENVLAVSQNIVYVTVASMTKIREIRVTMAGTYKVTFGLSAHGSSNTAVGRIYVNGVARGTTRTKTDINVEYYNEDLTLNANDLVQIYASSVLANGAGITGFSIKTSLPFPKGEIIL